MPGHLNPPPPLTLAQIEAADRAWHLASVGPDEIRRRYPAVFREDDGDDPDGRTDGEAVASRRPGR